MSTLTLFYNQDQKCVILSYSIGLLIANYLLARDAPRLSVCKSATTVWHNNQFKKLPIPNY